jgi:DNA-binding beta-propeller fold protein YncE
MVQATASLALDYAFVSSPNPIRASVGGANPNTIDVQVIVSNGSNNAVTIRAISIELPTGQEVSGDISTAPNLPQPSYDTTIPWTITTAGSTVSIVPLSGASGEVTAPILFTLPGIQVNESPGTVQITVIEVPASGPKVVDTSRYSLLKQPANFPVVSFYADPAVLTNLDLPVTLYWTCSDQGQQDAYGLRATPAGLERLPAAHPMRGSAALAAVSGLHDCVQDGDCYTCHNGALGVTVNGVNQTTDFSLDVVSTDSLGNRTVIATLTTTVRVDLPVISQASHVTQVFTWNHVTLHWLAFNARECTVSVNGSVVAQHAPTDTYAAGYPLTLPDQPGLYQISLTAHAAFGDARAAFLFPDVRVGPVATIHVGSNLSSVSITPDGSLALVTQNLGTQPGAMTVVDLATWQTEAKIIPTGQNPWSAGITPDGSLALASIDIETLFGGITVVDIAKRQAEPTPIKLPVSKAVIVWRPTVVRVTPDGTLALVGGFAVDAIGVIDMAQRRAEPAPLSLPGMASALDLAITPDGGHALVTGNPANRVWVLDIAARTIEPSPITIGGYEPTAISMTPDGSLALVACNKPIPVVCVIDVASRTAEAATIPICNDPTSIAITPDGTTALIPSGGSANLTVIDIPSRTAMTGSSPGQANYFSNPAIGITPDGNNALLLNYATGQVVVI